VRHEGAAGLAHLHPSWSRSLVFRFDIREAAIGGAGDAVNFRVYYLPKSVSTCIGLLRSGAGTLPNLATSST